MSTRVKVTERIAKKLEAALDRAAPEALALIGSEAIRLIRGETRSGKSIPQSAKHRSLSPAWIVRRGQLSAFNSTHETYSQRRSNLTFTGQLLDSLIYRVKRSIVEISVPPSARTPYQYVPTRGPRKGRTVNAKAPSNAKLAEYLAEQGRTFLGIGAAQKKIIAGQVKQLLRKSLAKKIAR